MKDRLSKYPGRVKLTPVDGQANTFDMVRADEPENEGTPINKNTFLTDETAEEMGLDPASDPTPNDALKKITRKKYEPKVGDVRETMRDDLGENWVLCNGDTVPEGEYPELREVLPYNTEWKRLYEGYSFFRPMSETGFWYINLNFNDSQANNYRSAMVYDSNTGSSLKITCPTIADSTNYGMFGMTHDGKQFILGVYDRTKVKIRLFTSTDLESWVECLQAACESNTTPYDITFDGTYILVLAAYYNSNSTYKTYVYSITPDTWTKKTLWDFTTSDSNKRYFRLCPYGLWSLTYSGETLAYLYNSGTTKQAFYYAASSCGGKFVFFNDRYVFTAEDDNDGSIHDTMVYDIVDKTSTTFYWRNAVGDSGGYYYLRGLKYNKNTNEWELNIDGGSGTYISYISADANPSDNTQYRSEKVVAHPTGLSMKNERMGLDRSQLRFVSGTEMYINNPNVMYLPTHDGDTYKYIYAGDELRAKNMELEYIESTGTQYINTGFAPNQDTRVVMTTKFVSSGSNAHLFGARTTSESNTFGFSTYTNKAYRTHYNGGWLDYSTDINYSDKFTVDKNKNVTVLNGTETITDVYSAFNAPCPLYLFANNTNGLPQTPATARIYDCKIYDNETLVRDYVPCRTWDGKVCLYDRVSGEYHYNVGAGKFIAGADVGVLEEV